jgi:acyl-CoA synthetase (NDP forming)
LDEAAERALDCLFRPRSVAVFGSAKAGKIAHQLVTQLVRGGYAGRLAVVNPKAERAEGFPGLPAAVRASELPGGLDLAVLALPAQFAEQAVRDAGSAGARVAVVLSSGFSETGNAEGERRLAAAARECGVRLIGPNCAGVMDTAGRLVASIEVPALPGRIAFITQSGAVGGAVLGLAQARGIGFSKFVSYGNRADLGEAELLEYLARDPETAVIALYVESIGDGQRLAPVLAAAASAKPLVAVKAGRTSSGKRAAGSHTGAMAGEDEVFAAAFRRAAVIRAAGIEEMLDLCDGFAHLIAPSGRRLAIVTNSGGPGILAADRAEELGLEVAEPGPELRRILRDFLSERCAVGNPVDLTVEGSRQDFERTLRAMLDSGYDGAVAINVATPFLDSLELARGIGAARAALPLSKPIAAAFITGNPAAEELRFLRRAGIPCFPSGERAALVLARLLERERLLASSSHTPPGPPPEPRRLPWPPAARSGAMVPEPEAWGFLSGLGLPFPAYRFCRSAAEASEAVRPASEKSPGGRPSLRFPLVMKVVSTEVVHKSQRGGVLLGLQEPGQIERAFCELAARFAGPGLRGVLLVEQLEGGLELIVGVKRDPVFGPVVLAGLGGVWTELLGDTALSPAPVSAAQALELLEELKAAPLLAGFRGTPPRDRRALASLLARVSALAVEYPEIAELDLNPVLVLPEGQGAWIADVRLLRA